MQKSGYPDSDILNTPMSISHLFSKSCFDLFILFIIRFVIIEI